MEPFLSNGLGAHLFSQFSSLVDSSYYHSKHVYASCMSKFAGAFLFWFSSLSSLNLSRQISASNQHGLKSGSCKSSVQVKHIASCKNSFAGFHFIPESRGQSTTPLDFGKIFSYAMRHLFGGVEALQIQSLPLFSLAAALVPPFDNFSSKVLALPLETTEVQMQECINQRPCEVGHQGCGSLSFLDLNWTRHAIEPRTGIEFPTILDNVLDRQNNSSLASEVLVGTGSRTMKIIRIKSLKVYAFGFYIHPYSLCQKLGPKYASIPVGDLKKHNDFYQDLLREDIGMTVRLVVNCNGMRINAVRDQFEKSLRARLEKTNPNTDYDCLSTFGSYFTQDIALPVGTIIDFQRTADGQLITKIGGNQIGAVRSKDLCTAVVVAWLAVLQGCLLAVNGHNNFIYKDALTKSLIFLEAQRSGKLPPNNRVPWRGDSALDDGKEANVDLAGGYYDAGDNVKYGMPMAYTITTLAWAVIEYKSELQAAGEFENALAAIRWGTDFFLKAASRRGRLYVQDELLWAAAWLYDATLKPFYLKFVTEEAISNIVDEFNWDLKSAGAQILLSKYFYKGDQSLKPFKEEADGYICSVLPQSPYFKITMTAGGMIHLRDGANTQYVTGAAYLLTIYADMLHQFNQKFQCGDKQFDCTHLYAFAKQQIDYVLGKNPLGRSYMVGYGINPPKQAHHRGASVPMTMAHADVSCPMSFVQFYNKNVPNPNELTGAILGGPDKQDQFSDLRWTSVYTEPCTYINSLAVAPLAKLTSIYG
ncbi:Glycoside hydrolase, family 9 [Corchorus capsularis]|uniref:Endoglucanase n=1 Tax=Corchorus capsularis TaxID=210143 RepID=A0A1R3H9M1_COCAP|nr:Glycoside hydrolase, family 9 [Corchorus capsularis]